MADQKSASEVIAGWFKGGWSRPENGALDLNNADLIIAALKEAGYQVVPVEPTGEMIDAALGVDGRWSINMIPRIKAAYRAMLAASQHQEKG